MSRSWKWLFNWLPCPCPPRDQVPSGGAVGPQVKEKIKVMNDRADRSPLTAPKIFLDISRFSAPRDSGNILENLGKSQGRPN